MKPLAHRFGAALAVGLLLVAGTLNAQAAASPAAVLHELTITARDFAYDMPESVPAGPTRVRLVNQGPEFHHAIFLRIADGHSYDEFMQAMQAAGAPPSWAEIVGGPNTPGAPDRPVVDYMDLKAGQYAVLCMIPSAVDGKPHVAHGMVRPLTVTAGTSAATAPLPEADATMTLKDYGYDLDHPLTAGHHIVRVTNAAAQPHEVVLVKLNEGKVAADVVAWEMGGRQGPAPGTVITGVAPLGPGEANLLEVDLEPGDYGLLCFFPDAKDGKPHVMHGMVRQIRVE